MGMDIKKVIRALTAAGTGPSLQLDFTTSLPAQVTFTRAGSRTAIVNGVLTTVTTDTPAIESWGGVNRGLSIEPAQTNIFLRSNDFSTTWTQTNVTLTAASVTGPDNAANSAADLAETVTSGFHELSQGIASQNSGTVMCTSFFFKQKVGATTPAASIFNLNQFGNAGPRVSAMVDGSGIPYGYDTGTVGGAAGIATNVSCGQQNLANGWVRAWITSTTSSTSIKTLRMRILSLTAAAPQESYAGSTSNGIQIYGAQTETGVSVPSSYKATVGSTVTGAAESAIISNISWLNASQGTFIVEHDCTSGVVLGSGANTIISGQTLTNAQATAKTAFAWDGSTSDLVNNGGATTAGGLPTFGSDIRLLATSGATNVGHIKSLTYYPRRLTVAQMQALTAPASTVQTGVMRAAVTKNRLPNAVQTLAGTTPSICSDVTRVIGSGDRSKLRVVIGNTYVTDAGGDVSIGNTVNVQIALIRVSTGEVVQVKFGGSQSYAMASGAVKVESDDILPSAFPSLTAGNKFTVGDSFQIKSIFSCAAGGSIPVGTNAGETGTIGRTYDAAATTMSTVNAAGAFTWTGTAPTLLAGAQKCVCPIIVGPYVSGDPITVFATGDSIFDGGSGGNTAAGTYIEKACASNGYALIQHSLGGQSQLSTYKSSNLAQYMSYCRVWVDEFGTNAQGLNNYYPQAVYKARTAGINYIVRQSLLQRTSSTDSWATLVNQTALLPYLASNDLCLQSMAAQGFVNDYYKTTATRDTGDKWIVNGSAGYVTADGLHPNPTADDLLATELQARLTIAAAALT